MTLLSLFLTVAQTTEKVVKEAEKTSDWASQFAGMSTEKIIEKIISNAIDFAVKLLIAIIVFSVGKFIINRIHKSVKALMIRRKVEQSLATFILSVMKVALLSFL